jgi:hypothetical protein
MREHAPQPLRTQIESVLAEAAQRGTKVALEFDEYDFGLNS